MCLFFFKHKTAYELRISDWSSDVCSSDLAVEEDLAEGVAQAAIVFGRIVAVARGEFGGEQRRRHAVLVGGPDRAVAAQEAGARAFLAAQAERTVEQTVGEPLEAHWRLVQLAVEPRGNAVDHAAADHGLAHGGPGAPLRAVAEQVADHRRHVVVRRQQDGLGHDAVTVMLGVAGEGDVRSEENTSELKSLMRISYAVF